MAEAEESVSVIIGAFDMARELPRTIRSLSPRMQVDTQGLEYELIVADNGSAHAVDAGDLARWGVGVRVLRVPPAEATPSPVALVNRAIRESTGSVVGVVFDGPRLASPGIVSLALRALALHRRTAVLTVAFHLGPAPQHVSVAHGYDAVREDELLHRSGWIDDGYRLFDIAVLAPSSAGGWFSSLPETSAIFMRRELWAELGGYDERFRAPGGGYVNHDLLQRVIALPGVSIVTLVGEGTFHQVHGGVATNEPNGPPHGLAAEYAVIHGRPWEPAPYLSLFLARRAPAPSGDALAPAPAGRPVTELIGGPQ